MMAKAKSTFAGGSHWLRSSLKENVGIYGQTILAAFVINCLGLVSSFFIMTVYDRVLPNQAIESLVALTIGVLIAHVFDLLLKSLRGYFVDIAGQRLDASVGGKLFERLASMPLASRKSGVGATASIVREFDNLRDFFSSATLVAFVDLPFIFLFIFVIWSIAGSLAFAPLAGVMLTLIATLLIQPFLMRFAAKAASEGQTKHGVLIETLSGLETVKSIAATDMMKRRWRDGVLRQAKTSVWGRMANQAAVNIAAFAQQLTQVAVVVIGVLLVGAQELTMGALIGCVILSGRAMAPLGQVAGLLGRLSGALASYRQLNGLMASESAGLPAVSYLKRERLSGKIEFREVSMQYPGQSGRALDEVSFTITPGEKVAVLGRNGSGKSTIVRLLTNIYSPTDGQILVDETDIRQIDPEDIRRNVGAVLQDVCLFSGTIRENIALGLPGISDEDVLLASRISGAHDFIGATERGYDQVLAERGEGLSGGQRQAIALARALAPRPQILVLDEPSSALDAQAEAQLIHRMRKAAVKRTMIVVTHRTSMLRLVDRIIVLDKGRVVIDGPRDQVIRSITNRQPRQAAERRPQQIPASQNRIERVA